MPAKLKKLTNPKAIDMECLMSTKEGAVSRDPGMIEMLAAYFKTMGLRIKTEDEHGAGLARGRRPGGDYEPGP